MLLGGDDLGRTQRGNNTAYCQDNELSWYDRANVDLDLLAWTRELPSTISRSTCASQLGSTAGASTPSSPVG